MSKAKAIKNVRSIPLSRRRHLDNMKLLLSHPDVERIVVDARKFLGLPREGFGQGEGSNEKIQAWYGEMYRRSNEMAETQAGVIKDRLRKGEITDSMAQKRLDLLCEQLPENYLTKTGDRIVKEFKAPANYKNSVRAYIISGVVSAPVLSFSLASPYAEEFPASPPKPATPEFYTKPTNYDLKILKLLMSTSLGGQLPDNPKPIKDIDKKIAIEKMRRNKIVVDEVTRKPHTLTAKDIAENVDDEFGKKTTVSQINEGSRELKDHRGKRFGK